MSNKAMMFSNVALLFALRFSLDFFVRLSSETLMPFNSLIINVAKLCNTSCWTSARFFTSSLVTILIDSITVSRTRQPSGNRIECCNRIISRSFAALNALEIVDCTSISTNHSGNSGKESNKLRLSAYAHAINMTSFSARLDTLSSHFGRVESIDPSIPPLMSRAGSVIFMLARLIEMED